LSRKKAGCLALGIPAYYTEIMRRCFPGVLVFVFCVSMLSAQDNPNGENHPASDIFPLFPVLETAWFTSEGVWRPDWPLELPPDAFKVLSGEILNASIEWEGSSLNCGFSPDVLLIEEFPYVLDGKLSQVSLVYTETMDIGELTIAFVPEKAGDAFEEDPWELEFLRYSESLPVLARAFRGGAWYFIYFSWGLNEILETWYDGEGTALGVFGYSLTNMYKNHKTRLIRNFSNPEGGAEFYYDSRGLLTESVGPGGLYKVHFYREDLPRYWERRPASETGEAGNFSLQWDEANFLVRIRGETETTGSFVDYRYEYELAEKGNWIERRETRMIRAFDLLVPSPGITIKRVLEYR
jgi:hypothetical protein